MNKLRDVLVLAVIVAVIFLVFVMLLLANTAHAKAPPDWYSDPARTAFFHSLKDHQGQSCCGDPDPDCRPVKEVRHTMGGYEVLLEKGRFVTTEWQAGRWREIFGDVDEVWKKVPESVVTPRPDNPVGEAIVCYSLTSDHVFCFVPWDIGG